MRIIMNNSYITETNKLFLYNSSFLYKHVLQKCILSFAISEFSNAFIKSTNREDGSFKSQYILETLALIDKGFTYNI